MKELTQEVFKEQPSEIEVACVDYDGILKFGNNIRNLRYTWASERWRGFDIISIIEKTNYKPLTKIIKIKTKNYV